MGRITEARLQHLLETFERVCPAPDGYHWGLDSDYGGHKVHLAQNETFVVFWTLWDGYVTKREAYERLSVAVRAVQFASDPTRMISA